MEDNKILEISTVLKLWMKLWITCFSSLKNLFLVYNFSNSTRNWRFFLWLNIKDRFSNNKLAKTFVKTHWIAKKTESWQTIFSKNYLVPRVGVLLLLRTTCLLEINSLELFLLPFVELSIEYSCCLY